jgi:cellulose synthase/poly-beta-1,6-N-acetylglucosamine synthase-like glycosyltransferase
VIEQIPEYVLLGFYGLCLLFIFLYSLGQLHLIFTCVRNRKRIAEIYRTTSFAGSDWPFVTIQLPIYNEMYVVERLMEAVAALDYPIDKFEIQMLDDSTDETVEIIRRKMEELQAKGIQIHHIRRPNREGYKAGALAYGLNLAKGNFIAIFDADFVPKADFLKAAIPHFEEKTGMVQSRWEHINRKFSIFTEMQALHLDAHFGIEQFGRFAGDYYMSFNGTGGIWRKECIRDSGGWEHDTLTEDLDLSYRAQMKGWKLKFIESIGSPAELPVEMGAIKSQQYRWMKGGAEVARKLLVKVWKTPAPLMKKIHASIHLLSSSIFIFSLLLGTVSLPIAWFRFSHPVLFKDVDPILLLFSVNFVILGFFYFFSLLRREGHFFPALKRFLITFIPFLSFMLGLSLHNSIAVIQGYLGKKTPFIRTPKFNVTKTSGNWRKNRYLNRKVPWTALFEFLLAVYFACGIGLSIYFGDEGLLPFMVMLTAGFGLVSFFSFRHATGS